MDIDHAVGIEVVLDLRIAPIDRYAAHQQRLDDFLRCVAWMALVLEGNGELAAGKIGQFVRHPTTQIVHYCPAAVHWLAGAQQPEEPDPLSGPLIAVDEVAEAVHPSAHLREIPPHYRMAGIVEMPPERCPPVPLIPDTLVSKGVVRFFPVRRDVLPGQKDPDGLERVAKVLAVSNISIKQKIGPILDLEIHVPLEHPQRKPRVLRGRFRRNSPQRGSADVDGRHER